jgi:hypothetical protein
MNTLDYTSTVTTLIISIVTVTITIFVFLRGGNIRLGKFELDFNKRFELETQKILKQIPETQTNNKSDEKKFALLLQYHSQGLAQSKISFWFSLIFASIGFSIIVIAVMTVQKDISIWNQGKTFITLISGTIIDAVSALFFVQSNKARQLMTDFFDKLRADRKFEESLKLADEIPDPILKSKLKIVLSINFADVKASDNILSILKEPNPKQE